MDIYRVCFQSCLSVSHSVRRIVQGGGGVVSYSLSPNLPLYSPLPRTCSNLGQLGPHYTGLPPPPKKNMFKLVHYEALTIRKWGVGIPVKCLLVVMTYLLSDGVSIYNAVQTGCKYTDTNRSWHQSFTFHSGYGCLSADL